MLPDRRVQESSPCKNLSITSEDFLNFSETRCSQNLSFETIRPFITRKYQAGRERWYRIWGTFSHNSVNSELSPSRAGSTCARWAHTARKKGRSKRFILSIIGDSLEAVSSDLNVFSAQVSRATRWLPRLAIKCHSHSNSHGRTGNGKKGHSSKWWCYWNCYSTSSVYSVWETLPRQWTRASGNLDASALCADFEIDGY
jgi:hypothetical protein